MIRLSLSRAGLEIKAAAQADPVTVTPSQHYPLSVVSGCPPLNLRKITFKLYAQGQARER
eukprot:2418977-Rhodomonas_salina.1